MADPIWVMDTSSLIAIKSLPHGERDKVFAGLSALVAGGRLFFPREVLSALKRDSGDKRSPDRPCLWALGVESDACQSPTLEEVRAVLGIVPDILDPRRSRERTRPIPTFLRLPGSSASRGTTLAL